jgi:hypothetical protein
MQFGVVELVGYRLNDVRFNAGDMVEVETYWRKVPTTLETANAYGTIALNKNQQKMPSHVEEMLGSDAYPIWAWQPNELIVTKFKLPAQADATSVANVDLSVRVDAPGVHPMDMSDTARLGRVVVHRSQLCNFDTAVNITFGGSIKLVGYRIDRSTAPGVTLLSLCWQSVKSVEIDYTVFVHAIDSRGALSNDDSQPQGGDSPTSVWLIGDQIKDIHRLPADAKQISIGLYRLDTSERLTVDETHETEFNIPNDP